MKDNQHKQLFTELTPEEGSVIEGGTAEIYRHSNLKGGSITFDTRHPNLKRFEFNDEASSIEVSKGELWQLFEHTNYKGQSRFIPPGIWNLKDFGFNDKVSSLKLYTRRLLA